MNKVKSIFGLLFILIFSNSLCAQMDKELTGRWELLRIVKDYETLMPESGKYYLNIDENGFKFNLEINTCFLSNWKIEENEIKADSQPCTEICCDDRYGSFYKNLKYTGEYSIKESGALLVIKNEKGEFYLKKKE